MTLAAHLIRRNGIPVIHGSMDVYTNAFILVYDLDVSSSYPNTGAALNVSKMTTIAEMICSEGMDTMHLRLQGMNLNSGHVNAIEFTTELFGAPKAMEWLEMFDRDHPVESR